MEKYFKEQPAKVIDSEGPKCPYCGYIIYNAWDLPDEEDEEECITCGSIFSFTREVEVSYLSQPVKRNTDFIEVKKGGE